MKKQFIILLCLSTISLWAQMKEREFSITNQIHFIEKGMNLPQGTFVSVEFEMGECITDAQRFQMELEIAQNKSLILATNPEAFSNLNPNVLPFMDPYRPKAGFDDYGYHTLQNQVDQNLTPNNHLLDYNCGHRTYDWSNGNHQGTDYILWPYPWRRMSENVMEVVAAAEGVIVDKRDGFNDLNCLNNGNPNWNGFVLEHADGSQTIYMHFKKNTLNSKGIGDTVSAGEYLGVAGSSGSSTIPHLHFEVRNSSNEVIDPYAGPCNSMNNESWWISQEPYKVPRINRLSTHSVPTQDETCPVVENTYEKLNFVPGDILYFKYFLRDIENGDSNTIQIFKPNGEEMSSWTWVCDWGDFFPTAYAYWSLGVTDAWMDGVYTLKVNFGGNEYETIFGVNTNLGLEEMSSTNLEIYPNPASEFLHINSAIPIEKLTILDREGKVVIRQNLSGKQANIQVKHLPKGTYVLRVQSGNKIESKKFIKN